jgi:hypothetical protein
MGYQAKDGTKKKTDSMEQGTFSEVDVIQKYPCILWNVEVH